MDVVRRQGGGSHTNRGRAGETQEKGRKKTREIQSRLTTADRDRTTSAMESTDREGKGERRE